MPLPASHVASTASGGGVMQMSSQAMPAQTNLSMTVTTLGPQPIPQPVGILQHGLNPGTSINNPLYQQNHPGNQIGGALNRMPQPGPAGDQTQPTVSMPPGQDSKLNVDINNPISALEAARLQQQKRCIWQGRVLFIITFS